MFEWMIWLMVGTIGLVLVLGIVYGITWLATPWGPEFEIKAKVKALSA